MLNLREDWSIVPSNKYNNGLHAERPLRSSTDVLILDYTSEIENANYILRCGSELYTVVDFGVRTSYMGDTNQSFMYIEFVPYEQ